MKTKFSCGMHLILFLVLSIFPMVMVAAPSAGLSYEVQQPDGITISVINKGDEWQNWLETEEGYSVSKATDGYWHYVKKYNKSTAVLSNTFADYDPPKGQLQHVVPAVAKRLDASVSTTDSIVVATDSIVAETGEFNGSILFILTQFNDRSGTTTESDWAGFVNNNIIDYYSVASNGKVNLMPANDTSGVPNDGVVGWVSLNYNHPNTSASTGTENQQISRDAIIAANPYVDFASYDKNADGFVDATELAVIIVVAGYERAFNANAPSVWGHKWSISNAPVVDGVTVGAFRGGLGGYAQFGEYHDTHQATMGIMVHEIGHLIFKLPDLYDVDLSSSGIGVFGVMSYGAWGWSYTDSFPGETPVLPCAWIKYNQGWVEDFEGMGIESITAAGNNAANSGNTVFRASSGLNSEYFLVENRQLEGYDLGLERTLGSSFGGLLIWHIEETNNNSNDNARLVELEEADGMPMYTSRGRALDAWYQGNASVFNATSTPSSHLYDGTASSGVDINNISASATVMTATFGAIEAAIPEVTVPVPGTVLAGDTETFSWIDNGASVSQYALDIGTTLGGTDVFSQNIGASTSISVSGLAVDGSIIYVRLWSSIAGNWVSQDYVYTASLAYDFDFDEDVDLDDLYMMIEWFHDPVTNENEQFDVNNDGLINIIDIRYVVVSCTRYSCATS